MKLTTQGFLRKNSYVNFAKALAGFLTLGVVILVMILFFWQTSPEGSHLNKPGILSAIFYIYGIVVLFCSVCLILSFWLSQLFRKIIRTKFLFWSTSHNDTLKDYLQYIGILALAASVAYGAIAAYLYSNY